MNSLSQLNANITELYEQFSDAQKRHETAAAALAMTPGDPDARARARATEATCADLRGDIKLLGDAQAAAIAADKTEGAQALKREAVQHLREAQRLAALRNKAGQRLDTTIAAFANACRDWEAINKSLAQSVKSFYRITRAGNHSRNVDFMLSIGGFERTPSNALLSQFEAAVLGIVPRSLMALNYQTARGEAELVAPDVTKSGDRLINGMNASAVSEGLPL